MRWCPAKDTLLAIKQQHCRAKVPWTIFAKDNSPGQRLHAKADKMLLRWKTAAG
jgi:hypothetical protein